MNHKEVMAMVKKLKLPNAYNHFAEGEEPKTPYVIYRYPGSDNFAADGIVYHKINELDIELYFDKKDTKTEEVIEAVLDEHGLFYQKTEVWLSDERLFEVLYEMEV